jgi:branched-chain amino acid transport system substrate-binding protein
MKTWLVGAALGLFVATGAPAFAQNAAPIKIGVLMPSKTLMGKQDIEAAQLAADQINAKGGVKGAKIELVVYDDANSPVEAVSAAQRLIDQDRVKMIIGQISSTAALAVLKVAQSEGVIYMPIVPKHLDLTRSGYDKIFQMNSAFDDETRVFNAMLKDTLKVEKIAYLGENSDAGRLYLDAIKAAFKDRPQSGIAYTGFYDFKQSDFNALATDAKASGADTLVTGGAFAEQYANVIRTASDIGYKPKNVIVLPGFLNRNIIDLAKGASEGVTSVDIYIPSFDNPANKAFVAAFEEKYRRKPEKQEELAYEAITTLAGAIEKAGATTDVNKIAAAIRDNVWMTPRGEVRFNKAGQSVSENFIVMVRNGQIVRY